MAYGGAMGYVPLREAIAEYLGAARAARCEASQVLMSLTGDTTDFQSLSWATWATSN
jgi:DNA-binding transcriptional MocR family regulator